MSVSPRLINPPPIPGLEFRTYSGPVDLPGMVAVANASWRFDGVDEVTSIEQMANSYASLSNCDPTADCLLAAVEGTLVAYSRVFWGQQLDSSRRYMLFGLVHPERRRLGLGSAMHRWNENRLEEIGRGHERRDSDLFVSWAFDTQAGATAILRDNGYKAQTYDADMVRPHLDDIPEAPMPPGLVVRTPRPDEMRKVWEAEVEAFRDHFGYTEPTEEDYRRFLGDPIQDPELWRIAWDGPEVAGQVRSFINHDENRAFDRKRGYTEDISVRRPYRRRGLARSLLVQSLHALRGRGMEEAALGVHMENPSHALDLYESVGFEVTTVWTEYAKPFRRDH